MKQIDIIQQAIYAELSYLIRKDEIKINKTNEEISQVLDNIKTNENEIEFLKDNGSDNQLFTSLHKQVANIKSAEASVLQMISNSKETEITFDEKKDIKLKHVEFFEHCQSLLARVKFNTNQRSFNRPRSWHNQQNILLGLKWKQNYN